MTAAAHTLPTRLLHMALLLAVVWQLAASGLVERPRAGKPGNLFYEIHEIVGLATLALVLLYWLWVVVRRRETPFTALFPWFSVVRLKAVAADARAHWAQLRRLRLPPSDAETPLASAVHGLGLLAALAMAASGAWLYTQSVPGGPLLEFHELVSNLMWAYLIGHASLALLHQFTGHRVFQRIFGRGNGNGAA